MQAGGSVNQLIVWGPGQTLHLNAVAGVDGPAPRRTNDIPRVGADGIHYGRDLYDARVFTIDLAWFQDQIGQPFADQVTAIDSAMQILRDATIPVYLDGSTKVIFARPTDWHVPRDFTVHTQEGHATLQFRAADPLIYDATETVVTVPIQSPGSGWVFPWTFPWTFPGGGAPGSAGLTNTGTITTPIFVKVFGPTDTGFVLENLTTNQTLQLALTMGASDFVNIDTGVETVLFQGTASRRNAVVQGSRFWGLQPGSNTVRFRSTGAITAATAEFHFRSARTAL